MPERKVVLVVEDQDLVQRAYARAFASLENVDIVPTTYGGDAVAYYCADNPVDFVILDLNLPDMTGMDVLDAMVNHDRALPPVVIASSETSSIADHVHVAAHVIAILQKPFDYRELVTLIRERLTPNA